MRGGDAIDTGDTDSGERGTAAGALGGVCGSASCATAASNLGGVGGLAFAVLFFTSFLSCRPLLCLRFPFFPCRLALARVVWRSFGPTGLLGHMTDLWCLFVLLFGRLEVQVLVQV